MLRSTMPLIIRELRGLHWLWHGILIMHSRYTVREWWIAQLSLSWRLERHCRARNMYFRDSWNGTSNNCSSLSQIRFEGPFSVAAPSINTIALKVFIFFVDERGRRNHKSPHRELNYFYLRKPNLLLRTARARFELEFARQSNIFKDKDERVCFVWLLVVQWIFLRTRNKIANYPNKASSQIVRLFRSIVDQQWYPVYLDLDIDFLT